MENLISVYRFWLKKFIIYMDTTYNLNRDGYKLLVTGIHDRDHNFYPATFTITYKENSNAYLFTLKSIKNFVKQKYNLNFEPTHIVSDMSSTITKAL